MPTLKIDCRVFTHPSITLAGNAAVGLWVRLAIWSVHHQPGEWRVPSAIVNASSTPEQRRRMLAAGLAHRTPSAYVLDAELLGWSRDDSRATIHDQQRQRIYDRDGRACLICGTSSDLTLDHIYPWSLGGPDTDGNLRTLCRSCNSRKGARV